MDVVTLKPNMRQVIESFLDTGVGDKIYHSIEGSGVTENEIVECQRNICVTHRGMYTSRQGGGLLVLAPEVFSSIAYVKIPLLSR